MELSPTMTGADLQAWRRARQQTRFALAVDLGVTETTIFRWERDKRGLPPFLWRALRDLACRATPPEPA